MTCPGTRQVAIDTIDIKSQACARGLGQYVIPSRVAVKRWIVYVQPENRTALNALPLVSHGGAFPEMPRLRYDDSVAVSQCFSRISVPLLSGVGSGHEVFTAKWLSHLFRPRCRSGLLGCGRGVELVVVTLILFVLFTFVLGFVISKVFGFPLEVASPN